MSESLKDAENSSNGRNRQIPQQKISSKPPYIQMLERATHSGGSVSHVTLLGSDSDTRQRQVSSLLTVITSAQL